LAFDPLEVQDDMQDCQDKEECAGKGMDLAQDFVIVKPSGQTVQEHADSDGEKGDKEDGIEDFKQLEVHLYS
jgi:hypothetical protein